MNEVTKKESFEELAIQTSKKLVNEFYQYIGELNRKLYACRCQSRFRGFCQIVQTFLKRVRPKNNCYLGNQSHIGNKTFLYVVSLTFVTNIIHRLFVSLFTN